MKKLLAFWLIAILLNACNEKAKTETTGSTTMQDIERDKEAIKNVAKQEIAAVKAGDANALKALISDDGEVLLLNAPSVRGDEAKKWIDDFMKQFAVVQMEPYTNEEIEVDGDLAYHRYSFAWKMTPKAGGDTISERGAGLHILRRKSDSAWVVVKDIWVPQVPPPGNK